MNAKQVRELVSSLYPEAMQSPLAHVMQSAAALTALEASNAEAVIAHADAVFDAMAHAQACIFACDGWTVETLGNNIESSYGDELSRDECDSIAEKALRT